jgi:hypothetical protein
MTSERDTTRSVWSRQVCPESRRAVPVFTSAPIPTASLTPLNVTLTGFPVAVVNKRLTKTLSPLNATFTKYQGGPFDISVRISIRIVVAQHAAPLTPKLRVERRHLSSMILPPMATQP